MIIWGPNWSSSRIAGELKIKGITQKSIADRRGVWVSAINNTIHGRSINPQFRKDIAQALGVNVLEIWPDTPCNNTYDSAEIEKSQ